MPSLAKDFELRRVIFGLGSILRMTLTNIPAVVNQRLADITQQLASLCVKSQIERKKILLDNQKHLKQMTEKGGFETDSEQEDDQDAFDGDDSEDEMDDPIDKLKSKKDDGIDGSSSDGDHSSDSDYAMNGGDLSLYESALESVDELLFV
jgi:hypothetical protein